MKRTISSIVAFVALCALPQLALAHAEPVDYVPGSSVAVEAMPAQVSVRFSERLDEGASALSVVGPSGAKASSGRAKVDASDPYVLSVPMTADGDGTYMASWSVVSSDDGHFTKGAFAFAVGKGQVVSETASSSVEIVQSSNSSEAFGMSAEFFGNGLAWALFILLAFGGRAFFASADQSQKRSLSKGFAALAAFAFLACVFGEAWQVGVKAASLASVQAIGFWEALPIYLQTTAGTATLWRVGAAIVAAIVFAFGRKKMLASEKATWQEIAIFAMLLTFAFFRAKISHATANPFHPGLSVAVNVFHLIGKDMWAGLLAILALVSVSRRLRPLLPRLVAKAYPILGIAVGVVATTACYIVWLHLKSPDNLFSTQWGEAFLMLSIPAILVMALRAYHVAARAWKSAAHERLLSLTLSAELAFALLVLYFSSIVVITSPPLQQAASKAFSARDQGVSIVLESDPFEDGKLLLSASGKGKLSHPVVTLSNGSSGDEPLSVDLSKRFENGYVFPSSFLVGPGPFRIAATFPQEGGYDGQAIFAGLKEDFVPDPLAAKQRPFDGFTRTMAVLAVGALILSLALYALARKEAEGVPASQRLFGFAATLGFLAALFVGAGISSSLVSIGWTNPYKALCESDGNMWHSMLPSKAGVPVSQTAKEGCMWGMGRYVYMFPDRREYEYYQSFGKAEVSMASVPASLAAGIPTDLTFSLKEADGSPAKLFVDMEKLAHIVIVSQDQSVFSHIHGDEISPSTFRVRYAFPKAGKYLVSVDYAHGINLEAKQFAVNVSGGPAQAAKPATFDTPGAFGGYSVMLERDQIVAGEPTVLRYLISKDGKPAQGLEPYLSAAMHISAVKDDLSAFIHSHGEVHPPGTLLPPVIVKNGKIVHSMSSMIVPGKFGPNVEAHLIFPEPGLYTVWGEFKAGGKVIPTSFTVLVS